MNFRYTLVTEDGQVLTPQDQATHLVLARLWEKQEAGHHVEANGEPVVIKREIVN